MPTKGQIEYREVYLRSDHWQKTRLAALRRGGHKCWCCDDTAHLDVHHITYARMGKELPKDLIVLCRGCHEACHGLVKAGKVKLKRAHIVLRGDRKAEVDPKTGYRVVKLAPQKRPRTTSSKRSKEARAKRKRGQAQKKARPMTAAERRLEARYAARRADRKAARDSANAVIPSDLSC